MLRFDIITIFPEIFNSYFSQSIIKRAQKKKDIKIKIHNLRRWTNDKRKTVDDKPYGGGPGMILKVDILYKAIKSLKKSPSKAGQPRAEKVIFLTPKGKQFNQKIAERYSKLDKIILLCGRYEGIDERITTFIDEKISIGPYILTGGEIPAMILVDSITRLIPKVIRAESLLEETKFKINNSLKTKNSIQISNSKFQVIKEHPQYTRPEVFTYKNKLGRIIKLKVPKVLLSGNHKKIKEWKQKHTIK